MAVLPDNLFSPTFKQQRLGLLFTTIMAIMVYLATLTMALQTAISSTSLSWDNSERGRLTVEIPSDTAEEDVPQEDRAKQALTLLRSMPDVQKATLLSRAETARLLEPWIKDADLLRTLPLPLLIDVQAKNGITLVPEMLQKRLFMSQPNVRINDHADWLSQLHHLVRAVTALGWFLIALTGITLIIAISLICRAALAIEQRTIELLHIMGATDNAIAQTFARHTRRLSWPAAVIGFFLALSTVGGLSLLLQLFMISNFSFSSTWLIHGLALLIVPCIAVVGAMFAARLAVLNLLRQET